MIFTLPDVPYPQYDTLDQKYNLRGGSDQDKLEWFHSIFKRLRVTSFEKLKSKSERELQYRLGDTDAEVICASFGFHSYCFDPYCCGLKNNPRSPEELFNLILSNQVILSTSSIKLSNRVKN